MKKEHLPAIIIAIVIAALVLGGAVYAMYVNTSDNSKGDTMEADSMMKDETNSDNDTMEDEDKMMKDDAVMEEDDSKMMKEESEDDNSEEDVMKKDEEGIDVMEEDTMTEEETTPEIFSGAYVEYNEEAVRVAAETGTAVLFFHAPWCPTCSALNKNIEANLEQIPNNVTIFKTDYDTYTDLKKQYGVTYQHTLVQVDAEGNQITKWSGGNTVDSIVSKIQ